VSLVKLLNFKERERTFDDIKDFTRLVESGQNIRDTDLDLPISVDELHEWEILQSPERYRRQYEFEGINEMKYFIDQVLEYQQEINHHAKITFTNLKITVETYTHDIAGISNLDIKLKKFCDDIYEDLKYFNA
jgi:pterin-4a-carbinolamine dehydratase